MDSERKDHNLKHLSVLTLLVVGVGFVVVWMLASVIWGMFSAPEREIADATTTMEQDLSAVDLEEEESLLDNLDVDQSDSDVMGATTDDPELDADIKEINSMDLDSIEKDYR